MPSGVAFPRGAAWFGILVLWIIVFSIRANSAADEWVAYGQGIQLSYIADLLHGGSWTLPRDYYGITASKPPLATWLGVAAQAAFGRGTIVAPQLPSALAFLVIAAMSIGAGFRLAAPAQGLAAALSLLLSYYCVKFMGFVRADVIFAAATWATMLLAWRAMIGEGRWTWAWLAAAVVVLAKGPWPLAAIAVALLWRRGELARRPFPVGEFAFGAVLFLVTVGAWFVPAWMEGGDGYVSKLVRTELIRHAARNKELGVWTPSHVMPILGFAARFFPWSLASFAALVVVLKRKGAPENDAAKLDEFCAKFCVAGFAILAVAANHRSYYLLPLLPALAWLAGGVIASVWASLPRGRGVPLAFATCAFAVVANGFALRASRAANPMIQEGIQWRTLARELRDSSPKVAQMCFCDTPFMLQYFATADPGRQTRPEGVPKLLVAMPATRIAARDLDAIQNAATRLGVGFSVEPLGPENVVGALHLVSANLIAQPAAESP